MIARSVQRRDHRCLSRRVRPHEGLALVVLTLLVVPAPGALAQTAPRQEPTELWRQFPLDTERSTPQAPAERDPAPPSSAPTGGSTGEDRRRLVDDPSRRNRAGDGDCSRAGDWRSGLRYSRIVRTPFRQSQAPPQAFPERHPGTACGLEQRAALRDSELAPTPVAGCSGTACNARERRGFECAPSVRGACAQGESYPLSVSAGTVKEFGTLERLEMYSARGRSHRTKHDESESLKAKINAHGSPGKTDDSEAQAEVETLKEKLAVQHAQSDIPPGDDLQTLKNKLDVDPSRTKPESTQHSELETLRAKLGAHVESLEGEHRTVPIGGTRSSQPERETPPNVPGKMSRGAARRNTTFSNDAPAASVDAHTLAGPPIVRATDPQVPAASSAEALPDGSMHRSRLLVIGAKVFRLALLLLIIGLSLLNIAVLLDIGVVS